MITISNSEIAKWKRCPRQWYLTYYLGMVPADPPVVSNPLLGTRIHTALEGWYGYQLDPLAVIQLLYAAEIRSHPDYEEELRGEMATAIPMIEGYLEWTAETGADADWETVATEADIQVPMPGPMSGQVTLRARLDQVQRETSTGRLAFQDYKTAANFERHEVLALDPQFKFYSLLQQLAIGLLPGELPDPGQPVVSGGVVTTLRRVKRTAKSEPPYYLRDQFWYTPEQIASHLLSVQAVAGEILAVRAELDKAYAAGGELERINVLQRSILRPNPMIYDCKWSCPHVQLCPMMDDGSDWAGALLRSGHYRQEDPYTYYKNDALRTIREELAKL
jgi:RecB family exonuclease